MHDAQGVDFGLVRATDPALLRQRVHCVQIEVRTASCPRLYKGQPTCEAVVRVMHALGFYPVPHSASCPEGFEPGTKRCPDSNPIFCCETDMAFCQGHESLGARPKAARGAK
jgi:hypothetical protein